MTSLQKRFVETGGRLVKHSQYYWLLLADGHLTRRLFRSMACRIGRAWETNRAKEGWEG